MTVLEIPAGSVMNRVAHKQRLQRGHELRGNTSSTKGACSSRNSVHAESAFGTPPVSQHPGAPGQDVAELGTVLQPHLAARDGSRPAALPVMRSASLRWWGCSSFRSCHKECHAKLVLENRERTSILEMAHILPEDHFNRAGRCLQNQRPKTSSLWPT